jgi:hypothetical protein
LMLAWTYFVHTKSYSCTSTIERYTFFEKKGGIRR